MIKRLAIHRLKQFSLEESAASLIELAIVIALFLLILFGLIDYGRFAFHFVTTERAMHVAARIAVVRPPACTGVPDTNERPAVPSTPAPQYGTNCNAAANVCKVVADVACDGNAANATAAEIWNVVEPTLPGGSTIANLRFRYTSDTDLGFLGGPYVPIVTVELQNVVFQFVTPLGALAALATGTSGGNNLNADIQFPSMSVSLPAEDLNQGNNG
ncbi:pilus assembly protein [Sinirhodobacter sp. WL0062]|uniref:Pilus assembly protein n=1 Tax=Rhodobacter flavimaris TaxID=2907145 RepID=A0ABS8YQ52_9RHOB|nr:TadE/TadG family type IV pilus assembly protein [Sinirhodobacter sp. WL0062]MCE5972027.1 pilus assembly protein [Sinirhodobacter sp. WL0062]